MKANTTTPESKLQSIIEDSKVQGDKAIHHLETELAKIRAGKASVQMLDSVHVEYYGAVMPLNQVANINTPDARTIVVQPWEKNMLQPIEKAVQAANLGFNPQNDGALIRISVPPLTEERKELVKKTKHEGENARIGIRSMRREANEQIKKLIKDGLAEDVAKDAEVKIQQMTDSYNMKVEKHLEVKEKEIMTI